MKTLLILGATGLVGQQLLRQALADPAVNQVVAPTRRALAPQARLLNPLVDYAALPTDASWWRASAALCALGTTLRVAGSKAAFRRVDHDYVLAAARLARQAGTATWVLNSSLGAERKAGNFYLRVKGEVEHDLEQLGFSSLTLVRPSLLDGGPRPDSRPAESAGLLVSRLLGPLVPRAWRPVATAKVAATMLECARRAASGVHVIESAQIQEQ